MKKAKSVLSGIMALACAAGMAACGNATEKNINVVVRDKSSGTREAFDTVVNDGEGKYLQMKIDGVKTFFTKTDVTELSSTNAVKTSVANDKYSIGYISLGALDDSVKLVNVEGVTPTETTVLNGTYKIQRPFVVMTNANVALTARAADFMNYVYSEEMQAHAEAAACIFLRDPIKRANAGEEGIEVKTWSKSESLPDGAKIVVRGSTSMEKLFTETMKGYAAEYNVRVDDIFDYEYKGSSEGTKNVKADTRGNVIGLSSAAVVDDAINSFNVCLDAVAVIVNKDNETVNDLTLKQLYDIFSGEIEKFSEIR